MKSLEKVSTKAKSWKILGKVGNIGKQLGHNKKTVGTVAKNWTHFGKRQANNWKTVGKPSEKQSNVDKRCTTVGKP